MLARTDRGHLTGLLLPVIALLLFAAALSAQHLDGDGFWLDEWWSQYSAGAPVFGTESSFSAIWTRQAVEDPYNLPGYPWLVALWSSGVGWSEVASRALPWLIGLLAVATIARVGADLGGAHVGVAAALMASTSAWLHYYMHELRTYTFVAFLTALLLLLYMRAARHQRRWHLPVGISFVCSALVYSHYFAAFPIAALALWHLTELAHRRPDTAWWLTTMAMGAGTLTLLPWLTTALSAMQSMQSQQRTVMTADGLLEIFGTIIVVFSSGGTALFALFAVLGLQDPKARRIGWLAGVVLVFSMLTYVVFAVGEARYAYALLPLLALLGGFGIRQLMQRGIPLWLIATVVLATALLMAKGDDLWHRMQRTPPQPFREVTAHFAPLLAQGDRLIYVLGHDADSIGVHEAPFRYYADQLEGAHELATLNPAAPAGASSDLARAAAESPTVWVVRENREEASDSLVTDMLMSDLGYLPCDSWQVFRRFATRPYAHHGSAPSPEQITVASRMVWTQQIASVWSILSIPPDTLADLYSVAVHILSEEGQLVAQSDYPLPPAGTSCRFVQISLEGLTRPASYIGKLVIYNWQTGERIVFTDASGSSVDEVLLGAIALDERVLQSAP